MPNDDLTLDERNEFEEELAAIRAATEAIERAARLVEKRGLKERAHKLRGLAQSADAQVYLLLQDWEGQKGDRAA